MRRFGIFTIIFCLSLILLVACSPEGTLDSMAPTASRPLNEAPIEDNTPTAQPTDELLISTAEKSIEPTRPQLEVATETPIVKEDPMSTKPSNSLPPDDVKRSLAQVAIQDLAKRLDIPVEQIEILEVREVVWSDASLGCPQPGRVYAQVLQEGFLIRLGVDEQMYFYHSGGSQDPFLCEETSQIIPQVIPKEDEFVPPPDSEID